MPAEPPTSLIQLPVQGERAELPHLYAKCELENPTGTHKDRIATALVTTAVDECAPGITVGSCGNLGIALARASRLRGIRCLVVVPNPYCHNRSDEISAFEAEVIPFGECYESAVEASRALARDRGYFDANPTGRAGEIAISEYGAIIDETVAQSPVPVGSIWIPVGNGTCAAGLYARARERGLGLSICVVGSAGNTALTASLAAGRLIELDAGSLQHTCVNEPLVNWSSLHAREAMDAVVNSGGYFCEASDSELIVASQELKANGLRATAPAGAAGLVGVQRFSAALDPRYAHVVVVTG